jgi:hypothetical protein
MSFWPPRCPSAAARGSFDRLDTERLQRRYVQRLEQLGYTVTLTPVPAA